MMSEIDERRPEEATLLDLVELIRHTRGACFGCPAEMEEAKQRNTSIGETLDIKALLKKSESVEVEIDPVTDGGYQSIGMAVKRPSWKNYALLLALYFCQGIPTGLIFGTIPFVLKGLAPASTHAYAALGLLSLASGPYNLKLLWSPLVDSLYYKKWGRRKTWIIPLQLLVGLGLIGIGYWTPFLFPEEGSPPFQLITAVFFLLITCSATLDIALDGWALTLLDRDYTKYSSTCQTIGVNGGYFFAFTVYLAFASPDFCNKYLRRSVSPEAILDLGTFFQMCGVLFLLSIVLVVRMKPENREIAPKPGSVKLAYKQMIGVISLPNVRILSAALLIGKMGFAVGDTLTPLKLIDKGFPKESLAIILFIDFALQLSLSWVALRWHNQERPLRPWQVGCFVKTLLALIGIWVVQMFPADGRVTGGYFWLVLMHSILSSFASTMMLVTLNAFFSTVCDPSVGGSYMTLLSTFSSLGSAWPRLLALAFVDKFTRRMCHLDPVLASNITGPFDDSCGTDEAMSACQKLGGTCEVISDGYYPVNVVAILLGLLVMRLAVRNLVWRIERMPISSWRIT